MSSTHHNETISTDHLAKLLELANTGRHMVFPWDWQEARSEGRLRVLLQGREGGIAMIRDPAAIPATHSVHIINPVPEYTVYRGHFAIQPLYLRYQDAYGQFNYHCRFDTLDDAEIAGIANHILTVMGCDFQVYPLHEDVLGEPAYAVLTAEEAAPWPLRPIPLHDPAAYPVYDFAAVAQDVHFQYFTAHRAEFAIPASQSLSSTDAWQWLVSQKERILAWSRELPPPLTAWQEKDRSNRFRLIYNLWIALARDAVADSRVADYKYRWYPPLTQATWVHTAGTLVPGADERALFDFWLADKLLAVQIRHQVENEQLRRCLNATE